MDQSVVRRNKFYALGTYSVRCLAMLFANGSLMQAFLLAIGLNESQLYLQSTFWQAATTATILLASRCADRGRVLLRYAIALLPHAVLFLCYLPLCFAGTVSNELFLYFMGITVLQAVVMGLNTVYEYKTPYYSFPPHAYGQFLAISGIMQYMLSFLAGLLMSWLASHFDYAILMRYGFVVAAVLVLISALLQARVTPLIPYIPSHGTEKKPPVPLKKTLCSRVFLSLIPAHLFRGFAYGTTTVLTVVCAALGYGPSVITVMVSVQAAASLIGCVLFGILARYFSSRISILIGSLSFFLLPLMLLPNQYLFLGISFLLLLGRALIDNGVPDLLLNVVDVEIAGPYNAFRMALHSGGALIATTVAAFVSTPVLLILTLVSQLISCALFVFTRFLRNASPSRIRR